MQLSTNPLTTSALVAPASAQDTTSTNSSDSAVDSGSATISANDFLQLLVTELQNQDPTADTDPNEYINQLVQVNSLEQLIQINQDLTPSSSASSGSGSTSAQTNPVAASSATTPGASSTGTAAAALAPGNLSAPANGHAASRVANALESAAQTLSPGSSSSPLDSVLSALQARTQQMRSSSSNPAR
ncbi:MAG TPA: flagellar hook capping FlgD N-terminal domain-containing protein [Acidobacteriaceae bacterium]|nr:flagellar hook capping FlgD N-terminal domain-containing protein [Acidobacteriaceae bacterium]